MPPLGYRGMEGDEIIFISLDESIPYTYANMCA